jgi:creatinine amidohydrolase
MEDPMQENAFILSEMIWPEAKAALDQVKAALIPVGSFEQHGPNATFEADSAQAYGFGKRLAARMYPEVLLAPAVPFGVSLHHMNFPGSITMRPETFIDVVFDVVWSLNQHGITNFLILNGHGGNGPSLSVLTNKLRHELGIKAVWCDFSSLAAKEFRSRFTSKSGGHACEGEISQALYLAPHVVRRDALAPGEYKGYPYEHLGTGRGLYYPYDMDEITANGALGDATLASEELGQEFVEKGLDFAVEFLRDFISGSENA